MTLRDVIGGLKFGPSRWCDRCAACQTAPDIPSVRERIESLGISAVTPEQRTPEHLAKWVPSEIARWAAPIKASGVSID